MQDVKYRSLKGRARRAQKRGRAARLHSNQLVMDYLDVEAENGEEPFGRVIPIRHLGEGVLPSVAPFEHVADGDGAQLELPISNPAAEGEDATDVSADCTPAVTHTTELATPTGQQEHRQGASSRPCDSADLGIVEPTEDSAAQFSIGGFLYGCAMGAAAAGVALLLLQAVLR